MAERRHERAGWILAWLGGFIWVLILSAVCFAQGKGLQAALGLVITCGAGAAIVSFSPWRHPRTTYRRLMAPIYVLFVAAVAWGAWTLGDLRQMGINGPWSGLLLLPIMIPLWSVGGRRWEDGGAQQQPAAADASHRR